MSRILLLTPELPYPPQQGASLRNYYVIRGLAQNHRLTLLTYGEAQGTQERADDVLGQLCESVEAVDTPVRGIGRRLRQLLISRQPDMAWRLRSAAFDAALQRLMVETPFDLVQIEGLELARAITLVKQVSPATQILFDDHNAEAELQWRTFQVDMQAPGRWHAAAYSYVQARRLAAYERWACTNADAVTVVSEADAGHIGRLVPQARPTVIPNCIDVDSYAPAGTNVARGYDLVFTGKMDYRPNVDAMLWFGEEIWPRILASRPTTTLAIVGQKPHSRLSTLAKVPGVTVTGRVDEIRPYLAQAAVFVMPFRIGSGTRLKLVEAMASGCAIVSTDVGAEGYAVRHDQELLLANEPEAFAASVLRLLERPELRDRLGKAAAVFARQYDWRMVIPKFETIHRRLLAG